MIMIIKLIKLKISRKCMKSHKISKMMKTKLPKNNLQWHTVSDPKDM